MADNSKSCYVGKIPNSGSAHIKSPLPQHKKSGNAVVLSGNDLRTGKKKK